MKFTLYLITLYQIVFILTGSWSYGQEMREKKAVAEAVNIDIGRPKMSRVTPNSVNIYGNKIESKKVIGKEVLPAQNQGSSASSKIEMDRISEKEGQSLGGMQKSVGAQPKCAVVNNEMIGMQSPDAKIVNAVENTGISPVSIGVTQPQGEVGKDVYLQKGCVVNDYKMNAVQAPEPYIIDIADGEDNSQIINASERIKNMQKSDDIIFIPVSKNGR